MEMIEIVNPTLDEYMVQVRGYAYQYLGDADRWYKLREENVTDEEDRDEFSFIRMALWDQLMAREFFPHVEPPGQSLLFSQCGTTESEMISGSFFWKVLFERASVCRACQ